MKSLLMRDPKTAMAEDEKGRTPLSLMFEDYAEEIEGGEVLITRIRPKTGEKATDLMTCRVVNDDGLVRTCRIIRK